MKVKLYGLGCKVNYCETKKLEEEFAKAGFKVVQRDESADIFVVNSCTVTARSDAKTRKLLNKIKRENKKAVIVLTGCLASVAPKRAKTFGADIIVPNIKKSSLVSIVEESFSLKDRKKVNGQTEQEPDACIKTRTRAFIKIQDGCNRYCSYCIIPYARGGSRSLPLEKLKGEVKKAVEQGHKEIVLVGINLFLFGQGAQYGLADAVEVSSRPEEIKRVRLGSLEPEALSDETILRLAAEEKFCPHFHISLQSGCQKTLNLMNRHYTLQEYSNLLMRLRASFDNLAITTDVIVGFPGETEEDFKESLEFVQRQGFAKIHVFPYSNRPGTKADKMPGQVETAKKQDRVGVMLKVAKAAAEEFNSLQVGTKQKVLFEERRKTGEFHGHLPNYTDVYVVSEKDLTNQICEVEILKAEESRCQGRLV